MIDLKKNEDELASDVMSKISLSKDKENLERHVVNLSKSIVNLSKKVNVDLGDVKAKVVVALDYSGSMSCLYRNGVVQKTINRLIPLGLTFDDNGSIDLYLFENGYKKMEDVTLHNYGNYVKDVIDKSQYKMGGTSYAPVLRAIMNYDNTSKGGFFKNLFKAKRERTDITFVLFITDGDNSDRSNTNKVIVDSSDPTLKTFIQFIGIGNGDFDYLQTLDDLGGRRIDNTGFSRMIDLEKVSDAVLYDNILSQFVEWLKLI